MKRPSYERIVEHAFAKSQTRIIHWQSILTTLEKEVQGPLRLSTNWRAFTTRALSRMVEKKIVTRVNGSKSSYRWIKRTSAEQLMLDHVEEAMTPPATPTRNFQKIHLLGESETLPPLLSSIGDTLEFDNLEMYLRRLMGSAREKEVDAETIELAELLLESLKTDEAVVGFEDEKTQEIEAVIGFEDEKEQVIEAVEVAETSEPTETSRVEEQALEKVIMDADAKSKQLQDIIQQLEATVHAGVQSISNLEAQIRSKEGGFTERHPSFQETYNDHLEYYDEATQEDCEEAFFREPRRLEQINIKSQLEEQIKFQRKAAFNLQVLFDQCAEVLQI